MRFTPYSASIILLLLLGCAVQRPVSKPPVTEPYPSQEPQVPPEPPARQEAPIEKDPFQTVPKQFRLKALESEKNEELPKALFYWKVVHRFSSQDPEVSKRIEALETRIRIEAERHFQKGMDHFQKKSIQEARREFLLALAHNPEHQPSLYYLKYKLNETDTLLYEAKEGDTLRSIARQVYKDPEKDFLIAYLNDLPQGDPLKPGIVLKLPIISPIWSATPADVEEKPEKSALTSRPRGVQTPLKDQAEAHYVKGIRHFLAEELNDAIQEWEETLRLNPEHPGAKRDLEKARRLLKNIKRLP